MEDWERLAQAVRDRRDELGISQEEVAFNGGPSTATMYLLWEQAQVNTVIGACVSVEAVNVEGGVIQWR